MKLSAIVRVGKSLCASLLILWAGVAPISSKAQAPDRGIAGVWQGSLETPARSLNVILKITVRDDGKFAATLDSPDQRLKDLPLENVSLENGVLTFDFKPGQARYRGLLSQDRKLFEGEWTQANQTKPLNFKRVDRAPEIAERSQTPKGPYPYRVKEVAYENKMAGVRLAATLTLPPGSGPFPAAILLTVAGPNDRDQSHNGHKPYMVLADYLTRRGIAVLRADDRGVGGSTGNLYQATISDFADDALAGVDFLKTQPEIDARRIGLIGNSEGGAVGPLAATRSRDVAFVVMLAGPGLAGAQAIRGQLELLAQVQGFSPEQIRKLLDQSDAIFRIISEEENDEKAAARLRELIKTGGVEVPAIARTLLPGDLESQVRLFVSPWYRYQISFDAGAVLAKVSCSVLAITGSNDLFLNPQQNLPKIHEALRTGRNPDYTIMQLPKLNHIFQTAETGSPIEYALIEETFSPLAMKTVADWILVRFSNRDQ